LICNDAQINVRPRHTIEIRALRVLVAAAEILEHDHREPCGAAAAPPRRDTPRRVPLHPVLWSSTLLEDEAGWRTS
jgi:hypothetical protein